MTAKELNIIDNNEYQQWLQQLCTEIDKQRLKAAMQLNAATLQHYWWLGNDIIRQQKEQGWGAKVIDQLSVDLQKRYGNDSGYSIRNLKYMKQFAEEYPDFPFVQVTLAQIQEMPILSPDPIDTCVPWFNCRSESPDFYRFLHNPCFWLQRY